MADWTKVYLPAGCPPCATGVEKGADGIWRNYVEVPDAALLAAGWKPHENWCGCAGCIARHAV